MFGYGIYTANCISKSINYCAYDISNNIACLLINEVALGVPSKRTNSDYYINKDSLRKEGCDSTWGQGTSTPSSYTTLDGAQIANGPMTKSTVKNASLLYDEFIVYDQAQLRQKYLILVKVK